MCEFRHMCTMVQAWRWWSMSYAGPCFLLFFWHGGLFIVFPTVCSRLAGQEFPGSLPYLFLIFLQEHKDHRCVWIQLSCGFLESKLTRLLWWALGRSPLLLCGHFVEYLRRRNNGLNMKSAPKPQALGPWLIAGEKWFVTVGSDQTNGCIPWQIHNTLASWK